jgi:hypothetical protein
MNTAQTLLIDLMPNRGSSVTAAVSAEWTPLREHHLTAVSRTILFAVLLVQ